MPLKLFPPSVLTMRLRSTICHVLPPFSERYSAFCGGTASMKAYTISGLDGATLTATRPHGLDGKPEAPAELSSAHVAPPSVLLNSPEPLGAVALSPPERNVQPRPEIPHPGIECFGMRRVHRHHRAAGRQVRALERLGPRLSAVGGLVDAALVAVAPELAGHAHVHRARFGRIDEDLHDALGVPQPQVGPVVTAVVGPVDAVADGHAVAHPRFAAADPDHFGVLRINRHRADRLHGLLVEHRFERRATVRRLPHAAARRADVDREPRTLVYGVERRNAAAHRCRADVARAEAGNRFRIHLDGGRGSGLLGDQKQQENVHGRAPPGRTNRWSSSGTLASILSYVIFERSLLLLPFGPDSDENGRYTPLTCL